MTKRCALATIAAGTLALLFGTGTPATEVPLGGDQRLPEPGKDGVTEIDWDDLIPNGYKPEELLDKYNVADLADDDPRVGKMMDQLRAAWKASPVMPDLEGRQIRIPGLVVPLEGDGDSVTEFLLVPYYGACIHVLPPPANQTVYVTAQNGAQVRELFDAVWVTGILHVSNHATELAEAGYTLMAKRVEPYSQ
jgi:uncharacterized protein